MNKEKFKLSEKELQKTVNNILDTVKEFNWNMKKVWVNDNCIYTEVIKPNGRTEDEGLYAGSDFDLNEVYRVYNKLKYTMNFLNILNDDNIMI